ncbi:beta-lactamase-like protein [Xylogone sp. PMI_703]|nr:beta-lactamase-like protein [Xylogone sp. PMI_703]
MPIIRADVYVAPPIPWFKPNGKEGGLWSPISCTLIHGENEAVLVDTPITTAQTEDLVNWIKKRIPGKQLKAIYITHGHGDHFFGIPTLLRHFPTARPIATIGTIEHMKQQTEEPVFSKTWGSQFPGSIDQPFHLAEPLPSNNEIYLEGHVLRAIEVGQADTHASTVLWVPDIKLAVCGDVVYGDVHQMLGECNTKEKRDGWLASIRKVEALNPELVVAGHKQESEMDGTFHLKESRRYIETFEKLLAQSKNSRELAQAMLKEFPTRFNPGALYMGTMAAFSSPKNNKL